MKNGDAAATARTMGGMSATAAVIEFLLNPVLGRLSDLYGRKPFLLGAAGVNSFLHALVAAFPSNLPINIMDRCISGAMIFCFFNPVGAALGDIFAPNRMQLLGANGARLGSSFGLGFAIGPAIGSRCTGPQAFALSSFTFFLSWLWVFLKFEETLPANRRMPFDIKAANPFSFVQLFQNKLMSTYATSVGLNSFGEYANIYDINFLYLNQVMGYGQKGVGTFAMGFGVTQIFGGMAAKKLIMSIGQSSYTVIANACYALGFALFGTARSPPQIAAALLFIMFGHQRAGEASGLLQVEAAAKGMGRGEIAGAQANFLAIIKIVALVLYSRLFAWGTSSGRKLPGLPYLQIAAFMAAAQFTFNTVKKSAPK
jgi:DHA1 family tetracycline resistance protein-like MFS transporter